MHAHTRAHAHLRQVDAVAGHAVVGEEGQPVRPPGLGLGAGRVSRTHIAVEVERGVEGVGVVQMREVDVPHLHLDRGGEEHF